MNNTNSNLPAMPQSDENRATLNRHFGYGSRDCQGLTKREMFCLHNGVADTGDIELDEIIRKGNYQKAVMSAMQGLLSKHGDDDYSRENIASYAVNHADAVLAELEK